MKVFKIFAIAGLLIMANTFASMGKNTWVYPATIKWVRINNVDGNGNLLTGSSPFSILFEINEAGLGGDPNSNSYIYAIPGSTITSENTDAKDALAVLLMAKNSGMQIIFETTSAISGNSATVGNISLGGTP